MELFKLHVYWSIQQYNITQTQAIQSASKQSSQLDNAERIRLIMSDIQTNTISWYRSTELNTKVPNGHGFVLVVFAKNKVFEKTKFRQNKRNLAFSLHPYAWIVTLILYRYSISFRLEVLLHSNSILGDTFWQGEECRARGVCIWCKMLAKTPFPLPLSLCIALSHWLTAKIPQPIRAWACEPQKTGNEMTKEVT